MTKIKSPSQKSGPTNSSASSLKAPLIVAVIVIAVGAGYVGFQRWYHPKPLTPIEAQMERDRTTAKNPKVSELELSSALIRLSERQDPMARTKDFERAKGTNPEIRRNAARALGFFTDKDALTELTGLITDPDASVRLIAVQAMGYRMSPERKPILLSVATRTEPMPTPQEKLDSLAILIRDKTAAANERSTYLDRVFSILHDKDGSQVKAHAITVLASVAPKDPRIAQVVNETLAETSSKNNRMPASVEIQQAKASAMHALHVICPKNRLALISNVLSSPDKDPLLLRTALMEIQYMKSPESIAMLKKAIAKKSFPADFRPDPQMFAQRLEKGPGADMCKGKQ